MKRGTIITVILVLLLMNPIFSQDGKIRKGNRSYSKYNYSQAVKYYEGVREKGPDLERRLARSYEMMGSYSKSEEVYGRLSQGSGRTFEDVWGYFMVLRRQGKYEESQKQIPELMKLSPEDSRVRMHRQAGGDYYKRLQEGTPDFELWSMGMNSGEQDFAPAYYRGGVVYSSTRRSGGIANRIWPGNQKHYLNLYESPIDADQSIGQGRLFYRTFNRKYHDGPVSFNTSGTLMAFTRNNYEGRSSDGTRNLQLFTSEYVDRGWTEPVSFPYNNPEYSVGHASLLPDGKTMYFISDMPGGVGGTDIYVIERRTDGTWGAPENLRSINTEGNEMFPEYHSDGLLFFSSDGYPGLGGLDMYVSTIVGMTYGKAKNLGVPLNSTGDDFSLVLDKDQKFGYLSSNRPGGKGSDDIYGVKVLRPIKPGKKIRGVTKDEEDNIISGAEVQLQYGGMITEVISSDSKGRYEFVAEEIGLYTLTGEKEGYEPGRNTANTNVPDEVIYSDLVLKVSVPFSLKIIVQDSKTGARLGNVRIMLKDNVGGEEQVIYTTTGGEYITELNNNLQDRIRYTLVLEKEGYVTNTDIFEKVLDREGEYIIIEKLDPITQDLVVGDDLGKKFQINPIYFDYDKYNIRPDASIELEKIIQIMNEYPTMVIELGSHTDCRGTYSYNTRLSDSRAKSSAEYVRDRITNPERIYGKGYGESKLVNDCACEGKKVSNCTEEEHQLNRRTEFVIVGYDEKYRETRSKGKYFGQSSIPQVEERSKVGTGEPGWYIIAGSFKKLQSAEEMQTKLKQEGYNNAEILRDAETNMYRVSYTRFETKESAEQELIKLRNKVTDGKDIWLLKK